MFGKKILSVVGLIFLGSQIISVEGVCTPEYNAGGSPACNAGGCDQYDNAKTFIATGTGDSTGNEYAVTVTYTEAEGVSCALNEDFNGEDYCVDKNGVIYERIDGFCNADVDGEDCTKYYNCKSNGVCKVNNSNRDPNAGCVPEVGKRCGAGYYLVHSNALATSGSGELWKCFGDGRDCENVDSSHPIGFLVNAGKEAANTKYIQCDDTSGNCSIAPIGDGCVESTYGQLYTEDGGTNYKLCLFDVVEKSITINESKKYLIEKKASILGFPQDTGESTKYVALEVDASKNIVPVASTAVGYYSTASNPYEVVTEPGSAVTLYKCDADTNGLKCGQVTTSKPIGFLKNQAGTGSATYIYCPKSRTCSAIAVGSGSCVNEADTGTLYSTNIFCVYNSGDKSITLTTGTNEGMYFVSAATSLFELSTKADGFIIVRLDGQGNLTVVKEGTAVRYRYTLFTDDQNKIHTRAEAKIERGEGQICGSGTPKEFTMIQWEDINGDADYADYYIATPTSPTSP